MLSERIKKTLINAGRDSYKSSPILFGILSSILAAVGLATNSQTTILGSMLFSPIGSLINLSNINHILKVNKCPLKQKYTHWMLPLLMVIIISVLISFLFGKIISKANNPFTNEPLTKNWPTDEMKERANPINALYMILIAGACSFALPLTILLNNSIRFVAIGIATALIPPLANIGIALSLDLTHAKYRNEAIITGIGIFIINMFILWLPSRYLLKVFSRENNIFKRIERFFSPRNKSDTCTLLSADLK